MRCKRKEYPLLLLGSFSNMKYGKMPKKDMVKENGKYPVFSGYRIVGYCDECNLDEQQLIVIARGVGGTGDVKLSPGACYLTNLSIAVIIDENIALKQYLFYYFQKHNLRYLDSGSAQSQITIADLKNIVLPIPPLEIQSKIVEIVSCLDDKIELNNKINENLERQAQAIFKAWFIDNSNVETWRFGTFSELIERTISGDWGKESPSGNNTEMVYCIRGADIPEVRAGNKGKMPTRYILPKNYAAKQLVDGDIVVEISGGSPTQSTGRVAAISTALLNRYDKGMVCTNFCKALKPIAGYNMYVYHYWQYLYDMSVFFSYENGTTGIKNLDINGFIETEPIHIAPIELVEKFDIFCKSVFSKVYANGLENERLAELRDTLLPQLMSGEIDVSDIQL